MKPRDRKAIVAALGMSPVAVGFLIDEFVPPVLIWGSSTSPPILLLVIVVSIAAAGDHYILK